MKHFEVPSDYKKAILAVAVVGGVGLGAGLVARRIWRSRTAGRDNHSEKGTGEKESATPVTAGHGSGVPAEAVVAQPSLPPAKPVQPDSLTTSGTFEKVPIPAALTSSQSVPPPLDQKTRADVKSLQPSKPEIRTPQSGGSPTSVAQETTRVTMKDNNDIVVVETEPSDSGAKGKSTSKTPEKPDSAVKPTNLPAAAAAAAAAPSVVTPPQSVATPAKSSSTATIVSPVPQQPSTA